MALREHVYETSTVIPAGREEIFPFFANAENLGAITPPSLDFRILTPMPMVMREGARIRYRIRLHGLPIRWNTTISVWNPPFEFVDEQTSGPYRQWIHRHVFEASGPNETRMTDTVRYALPFAPFGEIALPWVREEIRRIFDFRRQVIIETFAPGAA